jgi:hypothetical protein
VVAPAVGCGIGLRLGQKVDAANTGFDVGDDAAFTFAVVDNISSDCGGGPGDVYFTATKN